MQDESTALPDVNDRATQNLQLNYVHATVNVS